MIIVFTDAPEGNKEKGSDAVRSARFDYISEPSANLHFEKMRGSSRPRNNKKASSFDEVFCLVRVKGLEPSQSCPHKNLNLTRLPIPPNPHMKLTPFIFTRSKVSEVHKQSLSRYFVIITQKKGLVKRKNKFFPLFFSPRSGALTYCPICLPWREKHIDF